MLEKILYRIMWCSACQAIRRFKKEKHGKGQGEVWYCTKCGAEK